MLVVEHTGADGPGALGRALRRAGIALQRHRVDRDGPPPARLAGMAGVVVLGGTRSARSRLGFPTRDAEVRLLESALREAVPVLGICLGAQLLTLAAGGRVFRGAVKEVGFVPVDRLEAGRDDPLVAAAPVRFAPLSWHEDGCEPPAGAVRLACSAAYPTQAFRLGDRAYGIQFHPEVEHRTLVSWVRGAPTDAALAPGGAAGLLAEAAPALAELRPLRRGLFQGYAALVLSRRRAAA